MSASGLRVAISALTAKSYGGDSYFRAFLPALAEHAPGLEAVFLGADERYRSLIEACPRFKLLCLPIAGRLGYARPAWEQFALPPLLSRLGVDVYYSPASSTLLRSPVPTVTAMRNMEPLSPQVPGAPAILRLRRALMACQARASVRASTRVIAVSQRVRDAVLDLGVPPERIDVIYHGVDDLPPGEGEAGGPGGYLFSAAKFVRYANLETLLRAFALLKGRGYAGELRFAGGPHDRGYERELHGLAAELGIAPRVRWLGYLPRGEVHALMRGCDAFLFTSTIEACPFTLLEAMRMGAPLVCSDAPPMPEFAREGAVAVPARDPAAYARAVERIMAEPSFRLDLRRRALARAASFTWRENVSRLVACLERAARGSATR